MERSTLLGVPVCCGKKEDLLREAERLLGRGGRIYTVNPLMLMGGVKSDAVCAVLRRGTLCIPDGIGVAAALRRRGVLTEVLCGVELGEYLFSKSVSVGIVGGRKGVAERAFHALFRRYTHVRPAFLLDGYTTTAEQVCEQLRSCRPTLLFVCLGTPKQELLIDRVSSACERTVCIGLGGSLDVYAGDKGRAPKWVRGMHLEWLYRTVREPHRLATLPTLCRYIFITRKERKTLKCTKKAGKRGAF